MCVLYIYIYIYKINILTHQRTMKVCGESGVSEGLAGVCRRSQPAVQMSRYSPDLGLECCFERRFGGCEGRYLEKIVSPLSVSWQTSGRVGGTDVPCSRNLRKK